MNSIGEGDEFGLAGVQDRQILPIVWTVTGMPCHIERPCPFFFHMCFIHTPARHKNKERAQEVACSKYFGFAIAVPSRSGYCSEKNVAIAHSGTSRPLPEALQESSLQSRPPGMRPCEQPPPQKER